MCSQSLKRQYYFFLLFFLILNQATYSNPQPPVDYGCAKEVEVALYDFGSLYSEKRDSGIDKDLIQLLQQESKCPFKVSVKPRARIWGELELGTLPMSVSGVANEQRHKFAYFVNYLNSKNYVLYSANSEKISSFQDFARLSRRTFVGVVRTFKHGKRIDDFIEQLRLQGRVREFSTYSEVVEAYNRGQIQMMFSQQIVFPRQIQDKEFKPAPIVFDWEESGVYGGLIFSKKHFTIKQVENWQYLINKLFQDKKIEKIFKKHIDSQYLQSVMLK